MMYLTNERIMAMIENCWERVDHYTKAGDWILAALAIDNARELKGILERRKEAA